MGKINDEIFEAYKPLRNHLRKVGLEESLHVIRCYMQNLQFGNAINADIEVLKEFASADNKQRSIWIPEWLLIILTRELIINSENARVGEKSFKKWSYFSGAVNKAKDFENAVVGKYINKENALKEFQRIAHQQFPWQAHRPDKSLLVRYYKIFNSPRVNEVVSKKVGLSVNDIYLVGSLLFGMYVNKTALFYPPNIQVKELSIEMFDKFIAHFCKDIENLRKILKEEQRMDDKFFYHFSSILKYPIIRMPFEGRESLVCACPTQLLWRITSGLYYEVVGNDGFDNAFGESFQKYIGDCMKASLSRADIKVFPEHEFFDGKEKKRTVDWMIADNSSALFVECKTKRLSAVAKAELAEKEAMDKDLNIMAENVVQTYKTIRDYKDGKYPQYSFDKKIKIFPLVVTLEDWFLFGDEPLEELRKKVEKLLEAEGIPLNWIGDMPYAMCSAQEFEEIVQIIQMVGIESVVGKKVFDSEKRKWSFHPFLRSEFPNECKKFKALFPEEFSKIFEPYIGKVSNLPRVGN